MPKYPESNKEMPVNKGIEKQVDHEGLDTFALIDRVSHPVIRKQIIDLLFMAEERKRGKIEHEVLYGEDGKALRDGKKFLTKQHVLVPKTRKEIERDFDMKRKRVRTRTNISFGAAQPGVTTNGEMIPLNWKNPMTGEKPTPRTMSVIEAHEKGHVLRPYRDKELNKIFRDAVDSSAADTLFNHDYYQNLFSQRDQKKIPDFEMAKELYFEYLFSAAEMAERMSQLKNYFSMHGDELFTKEHIDYAREHYVIDTGLDNGMTFLFQAITPEKEASFLHLINSAGI